MRNALYTLSVLIVIAWFIGIINFNLGGLIHALFAIALISIILSLIRGINRN